MEGANRRLPLTKEDGLDKKTIIDCRPQSQHGIVHFIKPEHIIHIPLDQLSKMTHEEIKEKCGIQSDDQKSKVSL